MLPLALLFLAGPVEPVAAGEPVETLSVAEREPLILLVQSPKLALPISELLGIAGPAFEESTVFELLSPERAGIDAEQLASCTSSLIGCWYRELAARGRPPNVLLLGFFPSVPEMVEVVALYLDSKAAPIDPQGFARDEDLESILLANAKEAPRTRIKKEDHGAFERYFRGLVAKDLRPALAARDRLRSYGSIIVHGPARPLSIELDGTARPARGPLIRVRGVEPGTRTLIVRDANDPAPLYQSSLEIRADAGVTVVIDAPKTAAEQTLFWSGAAIAGAGVVVTALALAKVSPPQVAGVIEGTEGDKRMQERRFAAFCNARDGCSFFGATRIAPLGYSMIVAGAVWLIGELFTDEHMVWLPWISGIAAGLASYGVSVAID